MRMTYDWRGGVTTLGRVAMTGLETSMTETNSSTSRTSKYSLPCSFSAPVNEKENFTCANQLELFTRNLPKRPYAVDQLGNRLLITSPSRAPCDLPVDHVRVLHPPVSRGAPSIANADGRWLERIVPLADLSRYAALQAGRADVYLSQSRFWGWRRITHLAELGACFLDFDYYRVRYMGDPPERFACRVLAHCEQSDLPAPSYIVDTGRGVCAVWLIEAVPRRALPRWQVMQQELHKKFRGFGSDARALDAARVFRLAGTVNSKSGRCVSLVWPPSGVEPERYGFDYLAEHVLPWTREEVREHKTIRRSELTRARGRRTGAGHYTIGTLWATRLDDLQALRELRWFGPLPPGERDTWCFLAAVAMSWMMPSAVAGREILALVREATGQAWTQAECKARMSAVLGRIEAAARGKKVTWAGREVDPRYRFRSSTIIEWLSITAEEQGQLRDLVGSELKVERKREAAKEWNAANPERVREQNRQWNQDNKAERAAYMREYRARRKDAGA